MVPTFTVVRLTGEASGFTPAASSWLRRRPSPRPAGPDTYHRSDSSPPATTISDGPDKRLRTANQPRSTGLELGVHYAPIADFDLLLAAGESARELGVKMPVGNLYSSDTFYDAAGRNARMQKMGVMAVEMEAAALYCTAAYLGKRALAICSISDNLVLGTELTADERQTTFTNMMKIGLEAAVKMTK